MTDAEPGAWRRPGRIRHVDRDGLVDPALPATARQKSPLRPICLVMAKTS